jgi:hypothetical protein
MALGVCMWAFSAEEGWPVAAMEPWEAQPVGHGAWQYGHEDKGMCTRVVGWQRAA